MSRQTRQRPDSPRHPSFNVRIAVLLAVTIGGLVALSAGAILSLSSAANIKNTLELESDYANFFMETLAEDLRQQLDPAEALVRHLAEDFNKGVLDFENPEISGYVLTGALAAVPQIHKLYLWRSRAPEIIVAEQDRDQITTSQTNPVHPKGLQDILTLLEGQKALIWTDPRNIDGAATISVAAPIALPDGMAGALVADLDLDWLSGMLFELGKAYGTTGFVLHGQDRILAHPELYDSALSPLPDGEDLHGVRSVEDPILKAFMADEGELVWQDQGISVHEVAIQDEHYSILTRSYTDFGDTPWQLGQYSRKKEWDSQFERLENSILIGLFMLVISVAAALVLARHVARPIQEISEASAKVGNLDLSQVTPLGPSRITELNKQSRAFNQMLDGLRWFETYVPKQLVQRLIGQQSDSQMESREAELTVMFTDIVGFTALSESRPPAEVAAFLNHHFETLNRCIEAEGGTLDKYIGDAVMAFWGAPESQSDHAERACRAALAMQRDLAASGQMQHVKIAIHSGPLIVGNIGATGRMNYTVIGDTVNTCSRIEKLAGELNSQDSTIILISDATARRLGDTFRYSAVGDFSVKGKEEPVSVYRLTP